MNATVAQFQQRLIILPIAYQHLLYNFFMELYGKQSPTEKKINLNTNNCSLRLLDSSTSKGNFNIHVDSSNDNMLMSGPLMLTAPFKEYDRWYRFQSNNKWFVGKIMSPEMIFDKKFMDNIFPKHQTIPFGLFTTATTTTTTSSNVVPIVPAFFRKQSDQLYTLDYINDNVNLISNAVKSGILELIPKEKINIYFETNDKDKNKKNSTIIIEGINGDEISSKKFKKITSKNNIEKLANYMKQKKNKLNFEFISLFELLKNGKYISIYEEFLTQILLIIGEGDNVKVIHDYGIVYETISNCITYVEANTYRCITSKIKYVGYSTTTSSKPT